MNSTVKEENSRRKSSALSQASAKVLNTLSRDSEHNLLEQLNFRYELRGYQKEILDLVANKIENGRREVHIVAPPGAGKTIIGLQILSHLKEPGLILSPNTTIQAQWSQKLSLFIPEGKNIDMKELIGTHEDKPLKPITVLTYQVLSTPGNEQEYLEDLARREWVKELRANRALTIGEAEIRILELLQNNQAAYKKEISRHVTRLRKRLADVLDINEVLHKNAIELIQSLRRQGVKTVIFDECHHLTDYWAAIMHHVVKMLDDPCVVALTGTPPEGKSARQSHRYSTLVGAIDYQVPTPALVKEQGLAPFQDLVYFTNPTRKEYAFLSTQHEGFHELSKDLIGNSPDEDDEEYKIVNLADSDPEVGVPDKHGQRHILDPMLGDYATAEDLGLASRYQVRDSSDNVSVLLSWAFNLMLDNARKEEGWEQFHKTNRKLADAICRAMWHYKLPVPKAVSCANVVVKHPDIDDWMVILEEFASTILKTSKDRENHALYKRIRSVARELGYGITESGLRKQASPVDRVLAFSDSKGKAVSEILAVEFRSLQNNLRSIVVTDFEKMSTTGRKSIEGILAEDAGGAIAVFRSLLASPLSAYLNPCLVSGSSLLTDKRITDRFVKAATRWLRSRGHLLNLEVERLETENFDRITSTSSEWEPRLYVRFSTEIFETGLSKCLVGTRGLFGEGWDSQALNTLIDLTSATAPVTVKQLRGRSIRIKTDDPLGQNKVANNWDVVCIAPDLEKGLNDYNRFKKKHDQFFGIADDGQIEKGTGHVHPDLSDFTSQEVFANARKMNEAMAERAMDREKIFDLWRVGQAYRNKITNCIEISPLNNFDLVPPYLKFDLSHREHSQSMKENLRAIVFETLIAAIFVGLAVSMATQNIWPGIISLLPILWLTRKRHQLLIDTYECGVTHNGDRTAYLEAISKCLLSALKSTRQVSPSVSPRHIRITRRTNGNIRILLTHCDIKDSQIFLTALKELLGSVSNQNLMVARYGYLIPDDERFEELLRKFFKSYLSGKTKLKLRGYHPIPKVLSRSQKGRDAFLKAWNKYVSKGDILEADKRPDLVAKNFSRGPNVQDREIWE